MLPEIGLGHALPVRLLGSARHRPLRLRGLGRVPGPLRRGHLHGQGDLRRGCVRTGARPTVCRRTPSSPTISSRASSPGPGSFRTSRSSKAFRATTRWRSRASTVGSGATGSCCPGCSRQPGLAGPARGRRDPGHRALEDDRQPPAQPVGPGDLRDAAGRLVPAGGRRGRCGPSSCSAPCSSRRSFPSSRISSRRDRGIAKRSFLRGVARGSRDRAFAGGAADRLPCAYGVDAVRRDRAHALAAGGLAAPPPRMGPGRAGAPRARSRSGRLLSADARRRSCWPPRAAPSSRLRARAPAAGRRPFVAAWLLSPLVARWISLPPREDASARLSPKEARELREIARRTWRLLRAVCRSGVSRPAGRQLPGGPAARGRAADFADQRRTRAALDRRGQRFRLDRDRRNGSIARGRPGRDRPPRALPRSPLQLVRNGRPASRSSRATCPRSTAATSPRTCSTLKQACLERVGRTGFDRARSRRHRRHARAPARLPASACPPAAATASSRSRQLEEALREASVLLSPAPTTLAEWTSRLAALSACAETLLDIVRALGGDDGSTGTGPGPGVGAGSLGVRGEPHARRRRSWTMASSPEIRSRAVSPRPPRAAASLTEEMDFTFLYDRPQDLFAIGYRPQDGTLDSGHYDLLASEARLASFVAIARGDVPVEHWFHLGRPLTPVGRGSALLSWSGSMFEYLMPDLVLDAPSGSLLEHTNRLAVRRQIRYGEERGVPWGISEAAYNARDVHFTYQYSNFGVSGLGLEARARRGSRRGAVRHGAGRHGRSRRPRARTSGGSRPSARSADTASTNRSTTRRPGFLRASSSRS